MKVYLLMRHEEPLHLDDLLLVSRQEDAEKLIKDGYATYYEVIKVLSGSDIKYYYENGLIGRG